MPEYVNWNLLKNLKLDSGCGSSAGQAVRERRRWALFNAPGASCNGVYADMLLHQNVAWYQRYAENEEDGNIAKKMQKKQLASAVIRERSGVIVLNAIRIVAVAQYDMVMIHMFL